MCRKGEDPRKEERTKAFHECVPFFDGKCGERIKNDIIISLKSEGKNAISNELDTQTTQLEERIQQMEQSMQSLISKRSQAMLNEMDHMIEKWTEERLRQTDKQIERWTWNRYLRTREQIWNLLFDLEQQKMQQAISESPTYDFGFYLDNRFGSIQSAQSLLSIIFSKVPHDSVVDFGCGTGTWLWVAKGLGVKEILGIDGDYVPRSMLMIPESCYMPTDLAKPVELSKRFDLAISMEVAEHLPANAADDFVNSLCKSANVILFSAAHPGQGGDGHINEQPMDYWVEKFARCGYCPIEIKKYFSESQHIKSWYRENPILFVHKDCYQEIRRCFKIEK